jgi:HK97 family phage portal protein
MPSLLQRLFAPARPEAKASRAAPMFAFTGPASPRWMERSHAALCREGYERNPIVHRVVRLIAEAAASVPLEVQDEAAMAGTHPLTALLARPNGRQARAAFLEAVYGHLLLAGNAYIEAVALAGRVRELHVLRPDRMRVVPGPEGWAEAYDYEVGGRTTRFPMAEEPLPPILHLTLFHPMDDHYGLSPMQAAAVAVDLHNAAGQWNKALLDNAARPSGALVYAADGANLSDEQFERLKQELETGFQGAANAGRPMLLEGGLDWRSLSLSPQEMDFVAAKAAAAREIALAFGVPPLLLGLPGDNTHANYAEANRAFWRQTVLPLVLRTAESLTHWLQPAFGGTARLVADVDAIEALASDRSARWAAVREAPFLTINEKREALDYAPLADPRAAVLPEAVLGAPRKQEEPQGGEP